MVRVAAVGGYQVKVTLVETPEGLALDGVEREADTWRAMPVEPAQPMMDALKESLSALQPTPSALHLLLAESLGPKPVSQG
jgi:hypothetical protein